MRRMNPLQQASRIPLLLLAMGLAAAFARIPAAKEPRFLVAPAVTPDERPMQQPLHRVLDLPRPTASAHASCLLPMPGGDLLVAWFGGTREGARDVTIEMARVRQGTVVEQWTSLTRQRLQQLVQRSIRKLGNPVLWMDTAGRVHMHVVSVSVGGWSGSAINQLVSPDEGRTWSSGRRLVVSPLFNLSTLVRNQPLVMQDGTIGLPAYHEFVNKWGLWLRLESEGRVIDSVRMQKYEGGRLQPAVAATSPTEATAVLRSASRHARRVQRNATRDGGRTWPQRSSLDVPNPDAAVSMIRLEDGSLLMAANPLESGRHRLELLHSLDAGETWARLRVIEASDATTDEFSYPFLAQDLAGDIHLSYTLLRQGIRLHTFNAGWLWGEGPP
jgi:predicted neuraminidase